MSSIHCLYFEEGDDIRIVAIPASDPRATPENIIDYTDVNYILDYMEEFKSFIMNRPSIVLDFGLNGKVLIAESYKNTSDDKQMPCLVVRQTKGCFPEGKEPTTNGPLDNDVDTETMLQHGAILRFHTEESIDNMIKRLIRMKEQGFGN